MGEDSPAGGSVFARITTYFTNAPNLLGICCVVGAVMVFATQDMLVKWLSDGYPLHQIVFTRAVVGITILLLVIVPLEGGYRILKSKHLPLHLLRGLAVVMANMSFFLSLASVPLADAVAMFYIAPLLITLLSIPLLGEKVGIRRLSAVILGLVGVVVMVQPGSAEFQLASLLPLAAAFFYALLSIMTRKIGIRDKASTMAFYVQITFVFVGGAFGVIAGDGQYAGGGNPQLEFLLRAWVWPSQSDLLLMVLIGVLSGAGAYMISQGYRLAEAATAAPFEYTSLPLSVFWSIVIFSEVPGVNTWIGIVLICGSGLYVFYRETVRGKKVVLERPMPRNR